MVNVKHLSMGLLIIGAGILFAACQNNQADLAENDDEIEQPLNGSIQETDETEANNADSDEDQSSDTSDETAVAQDVSGSTTYALAAIAEHATAVDCWLVIEGQVYDVTPFIETQKHPGGEAIIQGCGTDATALFNERPKDGEPHSNTARSFLPQYLIGTLAEN